MGPLPCCNCVSLAIGLVGVNQRQLLKWLLGGCRIWPIYKAEGQHQKINACPITPIEAAWQGELFPLSGANRGV